MRIASTMNRPAGLAGAGMVTDSPRVDGLLNKGRKEPYTVLLVHPNGNSNGGSSVFEKYA